jgi:O-antigen/teichoic acid export membrane protein
MADELTKIAEDSVRGSLFLISGSAIATVIMAVQAIVITNLLGPELYGQYTLALLIPQVIFLVTDLGLSSGITRFVAAYNARGESARLARLIRRTLLLKIVMGFLFFVVLFIFAGWFASFLQRPFLAFYIQIASISILFQVLVTTVSPTFIGLDKTEYSAVISNLQAIINTVVSIGLVVIGFGIAGSIIGTVAGYVATSIISVLMLFMFLRKIPNAFQSIGGAGADLKNMMAYSAPLYLSLLLGGILSYYQYFVLARFAVDVDIGNFKAALNFGALIAIVSAPLTTVLLPAFCKLESCTEDRIRSFFKIANKYSTFLVAPVAIFIMVFSNQVVDVIYRGEFPSAGEYLTIYCFVYLLVGIGYITLTSFYNGLSDTKTTLVMGATTFIVLLILSPALASILKVQGVIIAFVIASAAGTIYGAVRARRRFRVEFDVSSVVKIYAIAAVSCVPSFLLVRFVPFPGLAIISPKLVGILVAGLLFLLAYATLAPLTKIMTTDELQKAAAVTNKTKLLSFIARPVLKYEQRILQIANRTKSTKPQNNHP